MFNVQCSMFNVQCSMFNVQRSMFNVQCSTFNVQRSMFNVQCSTFNVHYSLPLKGCSVQYRASQRHLVGIFQLIAHADASCYDGQLHIRKGCQFAEDVEIGGVALHRGAQRQYHLFHATLFHSLHQRLYLQISRSNAIHGRDDATQYMVQTLILLGILHSHHVLDVLHHADGRLVTTWVATDGTHPVACGQWSP